VGRNGGRKAGSRVLDPLRSHNAACSTNGKPRKVINQTSQSLP